MISLRLVLLIILLGSTPVSASAQEYPDVEVLLTQGVELRRQGNDEAALRIFLAGHAIQSSGRSHAQIGLVNQALGNWVDAFVHLRSALGFEEEEWVRDRRNRILEPALEAVAGHVALLELRFDAEGSEANDGAEVQINDVVVGTLPMTDALPIAEGPTRITISAEGYHPLVLMRTAIAGQTLRETISLVVIAPVELITQPPVEIIPDPPRVDLVLPSSPPARSTWITLGIGGGFLVGSIVPYVLWWKSATFWDDCLTTVQMTGGSGIDEGECRQRQEEGEINRGVTFAMLGMGSAFAITSLILFFATQNSESTSPVTIEPGPGEAGLSLSLRWDR